MKNAGKLFFSVFSKAHLDRLVRFHLSEWDFLKKERAFELGTDTFSQPDKLISICPKC
jgi:hypothetical protein